MKWWNNRRFKKFIQKYDKPLFDHEIEILKLEYGLSEGEIRQHLEDNGYKVKFYLDRFTSFMYYVKNEADILLAPEFAKYEGHITMQGCSVISKPSNGILVDATEVEK